MSNRHRPITSLRSGAHTDCGDRYTSSSYPPGWNTHRDAQAPVLSPLDEAMRAAADHRVPEPEKHG